MAQQPPQQNAPPAAQDPFIVAEQFVRQYYLLLQNSPWLLHHLYKENSVCTVQNLNTPASTVRGAYHIAQMINGSLPNRIDESHEGKEHSCEIKNIRYMQQVSIQGSLVVSVTGSQAHPKTGVSHRFQQTFVLASEGVANAYYVLNDMCSYEPELAETNQPAPVPAPAAAPTPAASTNGQAAKPGPQGIVPRSPPGVKALSAPASPGKEGSPKFGTVPEELQPTPDSLVLGAPTITAPPAAEQPASKPVKKEKGGKKEKEAATAAAATVAKAEVKEPVVEQAPKGPASWASMAAKAPPPPPPAPPAPPKAEKKAKEDKKEEEEKEESSSAKDGAPTQQTRKERQGRQDTAEQLEASIFVSGVPSTCNEDKLREIFGQYGDVIKVSVKQDKHFAIIDYRTTTGAHEALSKGTIKLDGSVMKIEARRKEERPPKKKGGSGAKGGGDRGEKNGAAESNGKGRGRAKEGGGANKGGGRKPKAQQES